MKPIGIIRKLDDLGRITIPMELRKNFNLKKFTPMEILADKEGITIRKYEPCCTFCGNEKDIRLYKNKFVCQKCIQNLKIN